MRTAAKSAAPQLQRSSTRLQKRLLRNFFVEDYSSLGVIKRTFGEYFSGFGGF
jgi:hypothetical protein